MILNISVVGTVIPLPPSSPPLSFGSNCKKIPEMLLWLLIAQPQMCKGRILSHFDIKNVIAALRCLFQGNQTGGGVFEDPSLAEEVRNLIFLVFFFPRKLYVLLSVLLCLLLSGLGVFFLFPHSVLVDDDGIKVVQVWFDRKNSAVLLAITVNFVWIWEKKSPGERASKVRVVFITSRPP